MEITANDLQTVNTNSNVLFPTTVVEGNCSIFHRKGSGLINLKGKTTQNRARFRISFGGNVAIPTAGTLSEINLAIAIDGEAVEEGTMNSTPTVVSNFNNVFASIFVDVPRDCCATISIKNVGTSVIEIQNANLMVERVA